MNSPGTVVVAMSPMVTGRVASSTFRRSRATIGADSSMPVTGMPRAASGTPTRPVPMASSRAGPAPARSARKSTVGSSTSGANMSAGVLVVALRRCPRPTGRCSSSRDPDEHLQPPVDRLSDRASTACATERLPRPPRGIPPDDVGGAVDAEVLQGGSREAGGVALLAQDDDLRGRGGRTAARPRSSGRSATRGRCARRRSRCGSSPSAARWAAGRMSTTTAPARWAASASRRE